MLSLPAVNSFISWSMQRPLGIASMLYVVAIICVLVYSYFESETSSKPKPVFTRN